MCTVRPGIVAVVRPAIKKNLFDTTLVNIPHALAEPTNEMGRSPRQRVFQNHLASGMEWTASTDVRLFLFLNHYRWNPFLPEAPQKSRLLNKVGGFVKS